VALEPYWTPRYQGVLDVTREEAAEILREALRTAIRRRVSAGERVGVSLSGGIDSTAVAAGLVHWCGDLGVQATAYSLVLPDDQPDELRYIDIAASELRLPGFRGIPSGHGALWHALAYQEAFALPSVTPGTVLDAHLIRAAAERGESALLDGQGGDEVFGHAPYLLADLARTGRWIEAWRLLHSSPWYGERPAEWQLRSMLRGHIFRGNTPLWYDRRRPDQHQLTPTCLRPDLAARHHDRIDPFAWKRRDGPRWWAHLAGQLTDLRDIYWVSDFLRRRGRLEGIESRSPLLDVDLVETALRLPPRYAFDPALDRSLLRHSMRGMLPETIRTRRWKADYAVVNHRWLVRILPALIALVGAPNAEIGAYLDPSAVERLLRTVPGERGPDLIHWGPQLWTLASAELWLRGESGRGAELRTLAASTRAPDDRQIASPWRRLRIS
jgi:asparagine synthase (glutamine-hydrolysing)